MRWYNNNNKKHIL